MKWTSGLISVVFLIFATGAWGQDCIVSTVSVQFGQYNPIDPSPVDAEGSVTVACSPGTAFTIRLDPGINSGGSFHPRRMRSALSGGTLNYNLYRDSVRAEVWGDGTGNSFVQSGRGRGVEETLNIYGRLPGSQQAGEGDYRDSITVTIEW